MGADRSTLKRQDTSEDEVIRKIAECLQSRRVNLMDAFNFLDRNADGSISWDEFLRGVRTYVDVTPASLMPVFNHLDADEDGRVGLQELAAVVGRYNQKLLSRKLTDEVAQEAICRLATTMAHLGKTPHAVFNDLDHDQDGILSWPELEAALQSYQADLSLEERGAIFHLLDSDRSGTIQLHEFCNALKKAGVSSTAQIHEKIKVIGQKFSEQGCSFSDAFSVFDRNGDGYLSREEWQRAARVLGLDRQLSPTDIEAVFRHFDANQDGYMSMSELHQALTQRLALPPLPPPSPAYPSLLAGALPAPPKKAIAAAPMTQLLTKEEPWEAEVLDLVRKNLSVDRTGISTAEAFRRLDVDKSNDMSQDEFRRLIVAYYPGLSDSHVDQLFRRVNRSASGLITIGEFIRRFG